MRAGCLWSLAIASLAAGGGFAHAAATANFTTIYSFACVPDGDGPNGTLVVDNAGNLYGTTNSGGSGDAGMVYQLTPNGKTWTETQLYGFQGPPDGFVPLAGVIFGPGGALYGTTAEGGNDNLGIVFQLKQAADGSWSEKILHSFDGGSDGTYPVATLVSNGAGEIFGTTSGAGAISGGLGDGTVFEMKAPQFKLKTLHTFNGADGSYPEAGLTFDGAGNLYGTTKTGGTLTGIDSGGVVFELVAPMTVKGKWKAKLLYDFGANAFDSALIASSLTFDGSGNLYGTRYVSEGGLITGPGSVFELSPSGGLRWGYSDLFVFNQDDGANPSAEVIFDAAGNLYGTTKQGGANGNGVVFELTPTSSGGWNEVVLHNFSGPDGAYPNAGLIFGPGGLLYGTTTQGGAADCGTVFALAP